MITIKPYSNRFGSVILTLVLVTAFSVVSAYATDAAEPENQFQTSWGAGIEVSARFDNREDVRAGSTDELTFSLALDTHSTNLFAIDIEQSAEIYLDGTPVALGHVEWRADREDSHHRYGWLHIKAPALQSYENAGGTLELQIRNVGRTDRSFEWKL